MGRGSERWHNASSSLRKSECYVLSPSPTAFCILEGSTNKKWFCWWTSYLNVRAFEIIRQWGGCLGVSDPCGWSREFPSRPNYSRLVTGPFSNFRNALHANVHEAVRFTLASIFTGLLLISRTLSNVYVSPFVHSFNNTCISFEKDKCLAEQYCE